MEFDAGGLGIVFPAFLIGQQSDCELSILRVEVFGLCCIPMYNTKELAELYCEQASEAGSYGLVAEPIESPEELRELLLHFPEIAAVVLNTTFDPHTIRLIGRTQFGL